MAAPKDEQLEWLMDQTTKYFYEGFGEPENDFDENKINKAFREIMTNRMDVARKRLNIEADEKFYLETKEPFGSTICELTTDENYPIKLEFHLYQHGYGRDPVKVQIQLSVNGMRGREFFDMVMEDYPRLLKDFLENNRAPLEFSCHVRLENEPTTRVKATEWIRVYLDSHDHEDEFFLQFEPKYNTSLQTLEYVFVSLVAIYDAGTAFFDDQPDRLVRHHLKNFKGRWAKKPEPETGYVIEYQSGNRMWNSPEHYYCSAKNEKQAALRFKRRYRSMMDDGTDTLLRVISQKSDGVLFEELLPRCYNYPE